MIPDSPIGQPGDLAPDPQSTTSSVLHLDSQSCKDLPASQLMQPVKDSVTHPKESTITAPASGTGIVNTGERASRKHMDHGGSSGSNAHQSPSPPPRNEFKRRRVIGTEVEPLPAATTNREAERHDSLACKSLANTTSRPCPSDSHKLLEEASFSEEQNRALIAWFHQVIWKHSRKNPKSPSWTPFNDYLKECYKIKNLDPHLVGLTLEQRQAQYAILWQQFMKVRNRADLPGANLDLLLKENELAPSLYWAMVDVHCGTTPMHTVPHSDDEESIDNAPTEQSIPVHHPPLTNQAVDEPSAGQTSQANPIAEILKLYNDQLVAQIPAPVPSIGAHSDLLTSLQHLVTHSTGDTRSSTAEFHDACLQFSRWQFEEHIRHHEEQRIHHVNMKNILTNHMEVIAKLQDQRNRAGVQSSELRASLLQLITKFSGAQEGSTTKKS